MLHNIMKASQARIHSSLKCKGGLQANARLQPIGSDFIYHILKTVLALVVFALTL